MSKDVTVNYCFMATSSYSGTIKMSRSEFDEMNSMSDHDILYILEDHANLLDPDNFEPENLDVFEVDE